MEFPDWLLNFSYIDLHHRTGITPLGRPSGLGLGGVAGSERHDLEQNSTSLLQTEPFFGSSVEGWAVKPVGEAARILESSLGITYLHHPWI